MKTDNVYTTAARNRKAFALVTYLRSIKASASNVEQYNEDCWAYAALMANVIKPSAATRDMVLDTLRSMESAEAHDAEIAAEQRAEVDRELMDMYAQKSAMGDE